jgi:hypothetical protein
VPLPPFPWVYGYQQDLSALDRYAPGSGRRVLRPIVEVSLVGVQAMEQKTKALVDSGSEHTLVAPWVARAIGVDPSSAEREMPLGIGGERLRVRFLDVTIRLHPPGEAHDMDDFISWETEVGFLTHWRPTWQVLLGQVGFFDRFTITMHRHAQALAVEAFEVFDERFGRSLA